MIAVFTDHLAAEADIVIEGDLRIDLLTNELVQIEAELAHRRELGQLGADDRFRLSAVERELNRRWAV
ncbi:MAG: hypothetical protein ACI8TP_004147 [Acidimicrobiales bacterium]|jgi:hypothetical protein